MFLSRWRGWFSVSRLPVTNDKTDGLSLDGYRVLTFHVQGSNNSSREVGDGEGKINFLFSFSYLQSRPTLYSTDEQSAFSPQALLGVLVRSLVVMDAGEAAEC